jgi:hypothetical protein
MTTKKKMITEVRKSHFVDLKNVMRNIFKNKNEKKETKAFEKLWKCLRLLMK